MNYLYIIGSVLIVFVLFSAFLGLAGIWGWFKQKENLFGKTLLTSGIVSGTVCLVTYVAHIFFGLR